MRDNHTVVFAGNGSYSNRGCEAILRGTTALLREQLGDCKFISNYFPAPGSSDADHETDQSIHHHPFPVLRAYSFPWIQEQINRKLFHQPYNIIGVSRVFHRTVREAEAVLMLGGDNFSLDYPNKDTHFRLCRLAVDTKLPVIIWGASIGPFSSDPEYENWAAKFLRQVPLICARETATLEYLASIKVTKNVMLTADPSYYLHPLDCALPLEVENALRKDCIGLNLSPLLYKFVKVNGSEPKLAEWTKVAVEVVRNLQKHFSMPILLIPHVTSELGFEGRDDYLFLNKIAEIIHKPDDVLMLPGNLNAAHLKWVISRVRAFAGARTHSTLAAISTGVPTICIGYSMKAKGIAQDVYDHLDWLITGQELVQDPAALTDRFIALLSCESEVRKRLQLINPEMVGRAREAAVAITSMITNK